MTPGPFDLNLRHLRALSSIAAHGSMRAAADAVSLSQPALTQGLAKLEARLGQALFERRPGGMVATEQGTILAERTRAAIDHLAAGAGAPARRFGRPERLMTMTQLRAFLALTDAGSFVGAGAATGLSQPALHRAVRDLEQVVGVPLVERRGRGIAISPAGRRLARGIRLAIVEISAGIAEVAVAPAGIHIMLGAMPLSRASLVPQAVARLVAEEPRASFDIVEGSWREMVEPLRDGVIDLMVGELRTQAIADLDQIPLHEDRAVIVADARHPLAGPALPSPDRLAAFPWIVPRPGTPLRARWEQRFAGATLPPRPIQCGSVMTIRGLLTAGDYLTLLSPEQVALEVASGVLAHVGPPLADSVRRLGITTRRGWRPTPVQARLIALLHAVSAETVQLF